MDINIDILITQKKDELQRIIGQIELLNAMKTSGITMAQPDPQEEEKTDEKVSAA